MDKPWRECESWRRCGVGLGLVVAPRQECASLLEVIVSSTPSPAKWVLLENLGDSRGSQVGSISNRCGLYKLKQRSVR